MVFSVENLGPIKRADVEIGDLTVICGRNNNGKTYLTYALGTFLGTIKHNVEVPVDESKIKELLDRGEVVLQMDSYVEQYLESVHENMPRFKSSLPRFLAMHPDRFGQTHISLDMRRDEVLSCLNDKKLVSEQSEVKVSDKLSLLFERKRERPFDVRITLLNKSDTMPSRGAIARALAFMMARMFDDVPRGSFFPETFVITCERTGAMLFRQDLINIRKKEDTSYPIRVEGRQPSRGVRYQRPVEREIEFVLSLGTLQNNKSIIASEHPEILDMLTRISGGEYRFDAELNQVRFVPSSGSSASLSLPESSSTVRSLAELYFYIKHKAAPGQLLIFDEPELNLHPSNQRCLARLLAALVNAGLKVFITTHSDYIIRELNALIRLRNIAKTKRATILSKYGISLESTITADKVRVYVLEDGESHEFGFDPDSKSFRVPSFDETIDLFNELYTDVRNLDQ